jgi:[ribosomal protein S5]-alanine N-acetyltransferase
MEPSKVTIVPGEPPELVTERLQLRGLRPGDAEAMYEYATDPEFLTHVVFTPPQSLDDERAAVAEMIASNAAGTAVSWGIVLRGQDKVVGTCGFTAIGARHARAELGYGLRRDLWGKGLMPEAVRAVVRYGFEKLGLNRIDARCFVENAASARVMEKAGMTFEGVLREQILAKGRFIDLKMYAILRRDWNPDR